jgi:type IV fimbrial biogenesis protein FimT
LLELVMPRRCRARGQGGLTLLEAVITLVVLAVLSSIALPSFSQMLHLQRLKSAADTLATDIAEARFEAARRGQPLHLVFAGGQDWCYAVATLPGCDCHAAKACQLKTVRAANLPGVALMQGQDARIEPSGMAAGTTRALLGTRKGEQLQVSLSLLGRASVCTPGGRIAGYTRC